MELKKDFGEYGGQFVPETLMNVLKVLEREYRDYCFTEEFKNEYMYYMKQYIGRPSVLYYAERLTKELGGAKIYLKREDLNHTGAHKINNAMGQALLAKKWERQRSLLKQEQASMGLQRLQLQHYSEWNVKYIWALKILKDKNSMFSEWNF